MNFVFDIGGVLLNFKPLDYLKSKIKDEEKVEILYNAIFKSDVWKELDRGTISEDESKHIFKKNLDGKFNEEIDLIFDNWYDILSPIEENWKIVEELKIRGEKLYLLSNFHKFAFEYIVKRYHIFSLFDDKAISYEIKKIKPEKEIYEYLLKKIALKSNECIFIDDVLDNILAAKRLGFETIHYNDGVNLKTEIKKYENYDIIK